MTPTEQVAVPGAAGAMAASDPSMIQVAGYELKSLLGSGGFGEVWKAIGPGGFPKAVKVLYGRRDGEQAEAELRALNRMRDLRHPFLLNIERVEVCDNRLVVVTELADGNLNERFEACQQEGRVGIPRDELLGYLRDAADALDFMYDEHGLQHLDIKPDNLLLQGRHVQLGDFGMAKDVSISNVSMINGFTPLYASPELFEGRPGRSSDQYSLAIVYQVMLTGKAPFNGRNAAQLTSQHLRSQPDLTHLAPSDRPVIARALSKTASSRYSSCRELVDELLARGRNSRAAQPAAPSATSETQTLASGGDTVSFAPQKILESEPSTPADVSVDVHSAHCLRPTLFVSAGGLGGMVLRQLKRTWATAAEYDIPSWQVLAVDSDPDSLRSVPGLASEAQLSDVEALSVRLRSPNEYRKARDMDMSWLSRRWLFNIPRSCRVEGMRPLGRLALQDHLPALKSRLRDQLSRILDADSVAASATMASVPFDRSAVDVYVVAGVSGGTGSGAVGDIALLVRELLQEFDGVNATVSGVLLHATGKTQPVDGIQNANTIACLKELRLLGTTGMGIPKGFHRGAAELTPFDHTWLYHCGEELSTAEFAEATEATAAFLHNVTSTQAATPWRHWRESRDEHSSQCPEPSFRLLGMSTVDADVYTMASTEAASLASGLLHQWLASSSASDSSAKPVQELLTRLHLTASTLPQRILQETRGNTGRQIEQLAATVCRTVSDSRSSEPVQVQLAAEMQHMEPGSGGSILQQIREQVVHSLAQDRRLAVSQMKLLVLEQVPLQATASENDAVGLLQTELAKTLECCRELSNEIDQAWRQIGALLSDGTVAQDREQLKKICQQFCVLTCSKTIYDAFEAHLQELPGLADGLAADRQNVRSRIEDVIQRLAETSRVHDGIPAPVLDKFRSQISVGGDMSPAALAAADFDCRKFADRLTAQATAFLLSAGSGEQSDMGNFPGNAWPKLQGLGGRHRALAWVPDGANEEQWQARLAEEFDQSVAVYRHANPRVSVVCEVEDVDGTRLLRHLQSRDPAGWEMAERIHTRIDVQW